jgi:methylmalonyl-CoA mutase
MGHLGTPGAGRAPYDAAMPEEILPLAAQFPDATREQWRELVAAVLAKSGVDASGATHAEDALRSISYDGIAIKALYTAEDAPSAPIGAPGRPPYVRGASPEHAAWDVRARHADPDPAGANAAVLADLTGGATSLWLVLGAGGAAVEDLGRVLDGVHLDLAPIVLDAGADSYRAVQALLGRAEQTGVAAAALRGSMGADPIGLRARTGEDADLAVLPALAELAAAAPGLRVATVDATVYHDAGASDAQEIGIATSVGVAYLRALTDGGLSVDDALAALEFRFAVTADQFAGIAKLRAARRIWSRVAELCGATSGAAGQRQHAVTSAAMLTQRDPWVNLLRTTIGCFAGAIGGAEAITVLPFDSAIGLPDDFARRIARNTSAILHDESSLARVVDAAGGSWFVESLTDELADAAWDVFTGLERDGGAPAALDSGTIGDLLRATYERRTADLAHRRAPLTGVSEFAFLQEVPVTRPAAPPVPTGGPLVAHRYAEDFEALRDRADAAAERPTVFLAALGPVTAHSARAGFAANLFAAGGIASVVGTGEPDELVEAFAKSGSSVACLCSSDKIYAEHAESEAAALKAAGAKHVWLAGRPGERLNRFQSAGIDGYLFAGCDALSVLRTTLDVLGGTA